MKMLKSKNIRRFCVLLAMLAPVVYLFGSLFAGLTGAHGEAVYGQIDYEYQYSYLPLFSGDINPDTGVVVPGQSSYTISERVSLPVGADSVVTYVDEYPETACRVYWYDADDVFISSSALIRLDLFHFDVVSDAVYYRLRYYVYTVPVENVFSCFVSYGGALDTLYGPVANSDYVFSQFFAKDNFLEQIGKDVLSDNPHGFVPFASFWKYLDNNMLHMGDMQLGLMGYGYVYYCCHVLLFDIAFILLTFFLDFIQKVNDKIVGGVD